MIQALAKPPYGRGVGDQRISDWVPTRDKEPKVPSDRSSDDVLALVRLWSSWAGESVNERHWRNLLEQAQPVRVLRTVPTGPGQSVREFTDPFTLEVHEAVDGGGASGLPLLPLYVERQHDRWLADVANDLVARAAGQPTGVLAVLVGGSSTGKTRACWEALNLLPPDWRLVLPLVPSPAEALIAALAEITPRTVLWLDEIHRFLSGDRGEQAAAHLREVLNDPRRGPLLVLGTTWPDLWADLVKPRKTATAGIRTHRPVPSSPGSTTGYRTPSRTRTCPSCGASPLRTSGSRKRWNRGSQGGSRSTSRTVEHSSTGMRPPRLFRGP
ncbi:hypothetical protein [Streptomyces sp. NPDC007904]|uniref:hypothetical protein n=1 Tax=Streptomyces sp. NPDC007904 TaxID=3364787 RepID=UPI0036E41E74